MSLYSRPCFLQWGADVASTVFGEELAAGFKRQAERVDLQWSGIVARPLYACTGGGTQCGGVAAMSPLLAFPRERQEWRCAACRRECAPVSDSAPRRTLRLYPLVLTTKGQVTPMRSRPVVALVFAPPVEFSWGTEVAPTARAAEPIKKAPLNTFQYKEDESDAIWMTARAFKGACLNIVT